MTGHRNGGAAVVKTLAAHGVDTIFGIPGTHNLEHLNENLGAVDVRLTSDDLREIETAFGAITVHGGRMNESQMELVQA